MQKSLGALFSSHGLSYTKKLKLHAKNTSKTLKIRKKSKDVNFSRLYLVKLTRLQTKILKS